MNEQINADADRKTMLYINVEYLNLNESRKHTAYIHCAVPSVSLNLIDSKYIRALLILVHSVFSDFYTINCVFNCAVL